MFTLINNISWAGQGSLLYISLALMFVAICLLYRYYNVHKIIQNVIPQKVRHVVLKHGSLTRYAVKVFLFFVGFLFLCIAMLRPQWGNKEEIVHQEGRDILIALDISRSMLAQDQEPNRLEFAKEKIKKILYNLPCDRVGLLLFSGETIVRCPLTSDYAAFFMFLDQVDVEVISTGTTAIDKAIRQSIAVYDDMEERKTKLLCLFTDGEDFSANLSGVKDRAAQKGLTICTFGVGTEHGAPVPILDDKGQQIGFEKEDNGSVVMSKLNQGILKNLSQQTGGKYFYASDSDIDVKGLVSYIEKLEKDKFEDKKCDSLQERYNYFVIISLISFVLEWLL